MSSPTFFSEVAVLYIFDLRGWTDLSRVSYIDSMNRKHMSYTLAVNHLADFSVRPAFGWSSPVNLRLLLHLAGLVL
jgi:hypothetical protein